MTGRGRGRGSSVGGAEGGRDLDPAVSRSREGGNGAVMEDENVTNLSTETVPIKNNDDLVDSSIVLYADRWLPMAQKVIEDVYRQRKSKNAGKLETYYNQLELIIPTLMNHSWAFVTFPDAISVVFHRLNFSDVFFCKNIYTVSVSKIYYPNAMFIKRGSPLREIFNTRILLMVERGFLSRLNQFYDRNTQIRCVQENLSYRGGLTMRDTVTPFLFILGGLVTSFLILVWERKPWISASQQEFKVSL